MSIGLDIYLKDIKEEMEVTFPVMVHSHLRFSQLLREP